jgi:tRNA A-37 threonylcarbamoyl transferase component Bud32
LHINTSRTHQRSEIGNRKKKSKDVPKTSERKTGKIFFPADLNDRETSYVSEGEKNPSDAGKSGYLSTFVQKIQAKIQCESSKQSIIMPPSLPKNADPLKKYTKHGNSSNKAKEKVTSKDLFSKTNKGSVTPQLVGQGQHFFLNNYNLNSTLKNSDVGYQLATSGHQSVRKNTFHTQGSILTSPTNPVPKNTFEKESAGDMLDHLDKASSNVKTDANDDTQVKTTTTINDDFTDAKSPRVADPKTSKNAGKKEAPGKKDYDFNHMFKIINFLEQDKDLSEKRIELRAKLKDLKHQTEDQHHFKSPENFNAKDLNKVFCHEDFTSSPADLDDYNITKNLGQGSYAVVKLATHKKSNVRVAIKVYEKVKLLDIDKMKNVKTEIQNLKELDHPNIIKLFKTIHTVKQIYLIMEYMGSSSLYDYTCFKNKFRVPEEECRDIFKKICSSIKYCHSKNVIHRDIKMENILINKNNIVKLIDFGFSIVCAADEKLSMFCGTPSYMAPEIVGKKPYLGKPADVWALGILLYKLLTGQFPFKGKTDKELFSCIRSGRYDSPNFLSQEVKSLIRSMLKVRALERIKAEQLIQHPWFYDGLDSDEKDSESSSF